MSNTRHYGKEGFHDEWTEKENCDNYCDAFAFIENGEIHLPHSCDYWTIGGAKEAEQLIADLLELIRRLPPENEKVI